AMSNPIPSAWAVTTAPAVAEAAAGPAADAGIGAPAARNGAIAPPLMKFKTITPVTAPAATKAKRKPLSPTAVSGVAKLEKNEAGASAADADTSPLGSPLAHIGKAAIASARTRPNHPSLTRTDRRSRGQAAHRSSGVGRTIRRRLNIK